MSSKISVPELRASFFSLCWVLKIQVLGSGHPKADEIVMSNMAIAFDRIFSDVQVVNLLFFVIYIKHM